MIQRQGEQLTCFAIIIFIQPHTAIIIVIGTLLTICPQSYTLAFGTGFEFDRNSIVVTLVNVLAKSVIPLSEENLGEFVNGVLLRKT